MRVMDCSSPVEPKGYLRAFLVGNVLRLEGELDIATASVFEEALEDAEAALGFASLTIDMRALEFMDCAGLRVLLAASERAAACGRELEVMTWTGAAARLLDLCGLEPALSFRRTRGRPAHRTPGSWERSPIAR